VGLGHWKALIPAQPVCKDFLLLQLYKQEESLHLQTSSDMKKKRKLFPPVLSGNIVEKDSNTVRLLTLLPLSASETAHALKTDFL